MLKINLVLFSIFALFFSVGLDTQDVFGGSCNPVESISFDEDVYGYGENAHVLIEHTDAYPPSSTSIKFYSTSDPTGEIFPIGETGAESGLYEIEIELTSGFVIINPGDTITVQSVCEEFGVFSDSATVVIPTYTWDGGGSTDLWSDEENWSSDYVPSGDEIIVIEYPFCISESSAAISLDVADFTLDESLHIGSGCSLLIETYMNNNGIITIDGVLDVTEEYALTNLPSAVINVNSGGELNVLAIGELYNEIGGEINILTGGKLFNSQGGIDISKGYIQNGATDSIYTDGIIENNGTFANFGHIEVDCNGSIIGSEPINDFSEDIDFICVAPQPTTVILDPIADPNAGDKFSVTGRLIDDITGLGVSGKTITFVGNGSAPLSPAITNGFTVNDAAGITINTVSSDNILRGNIGTEFIFPSNPTQVILSLADMGTSTFDVLATDSISNNFTAQGVGQGANNGTFTLSDAQGISSIEITSQTGTAGITRVEAFNSELKKYIDEEFTPASGPLTLSFAQGSFFSVGTSQVTIATDLVVNATFAGDGNYEASASTDNPPTNVQTYSVLFATAGGAGGASTVIPDAGTGYTNTGACADADGDSLCNTWEGAGNGVPITGGGLFTLAGSDPNRKDIYVEVDYMENHNPFLIASGDTTSPITDVIAAFNAAPVTNPNGVNGINLHVDQGQQLTDIPLLTVWTDSLGTCVDFDCLKAANFGNPGDSTALKNARAMAYHYFIFAHSVGGSSGISELPGNDGIVSLGVGFSEANGAHAGTEGSKNEIAGTFMHELGHNLNLDHGGPATAADRSANCKPNHDSVMTYSRQLPTLLGNNWKLDFSDGGLGPATGLRENGGAIPSAGNIAETNGNLVHTDNINRPGTDPLPWIIWGTPGVSPPYLIQQSRVSGVGTPANIDWDGNGVIAAGSNLNRDINGLGFYGCEASATRSTTPFRNNAEWTNLLYNFRGVSGGAYDASQPIQAYQAAVDDIDGEIIDQHQTASAYHNALFPWKADSSMTLKKGLPIPIDVKLFDGANNILGKDDGTLKYKLFKSGQDLPKASGSLIYSKILKVWVTAIHPSKITTKGDYYIQLTFETPQGTKVTKDQLPANNPVYTNPIAGNPLMSLKVKVT